MERFAKEVLVDSVVELGSWVPLEEVEVGAVPFRRIALRLHPSSVSVDDTLILIPPTPPNLQVFTS